MDSKLREELWNVARRYLGEEEIHGIPHVRRVNNNLLLYQSEFPQRVTPEVMDAIEASVILHDVGRSKGGDHASNSAQILQELFTDELAAVLNQDWIIYAIARHSSGPKDGEPDEVIKRDDLRGQTMGVLVLLDHMDTLGPIGIYRNIRFLPDVKLEPLDKDRQAMEKRLGRYLFSPAEVTSEERKQKTISIFDLLAYHCAATDHICRRVKPFIEGSRLKREIDERMNNMLNFIQLLHRESF